MPKPDFASVPEWYHKYLIAVPEDDLLHAFDNHSALLLDTLEGLPEKAWDHRYAPDKWSIKEMVQHIIDAERIFCYRALSFARGETAALPGFDEVTYALNSKADRRSASSLLQELKVVQQGSIHLFHSFDEEQRAASGIANGATVSVNSVGFILIGHCLHHLSILKERYLPGIDSAM
ncbi:MAG TPA: DinB family protein [Flavisolibacter sp.]